MMAAALFVCGVVVMFNGYLALGVILFVMAALQ